MTDLQRDYSGMDTSGMDFPANTSTTGLVESGWLDFGEISQAGDVDWFKVNLTAGVTYQFQIEAGTINGLFDPQLAIYNANNGLLAAAMIGQGFQLKYLDLTPTTSGDYYLAASGDGNSGGYQLSVLAGATATVTPTTPTVISGTAANDALISTAASDSIDGGSGIDTVTFSGTRTSYTLTKTVSGWTAGYSAEHTDTLANIERLQFADGKLALDLDGNAGITAKILGAVFGSTSVANKEYTGIGLSFLDNGMTYEALAELAIGATGTSTPQQIVNLLWTNVVGSAPTTEQAQPFIDLLHNGMTIGALGVLAAETNINQININLVGLAATGLEYI